MNMTADMRMKRISPFIPESAAISDPEDRKYPFHPEIRCHIAGLPESVIISIIIMRFQLPGQKFFRIFYYKRIPENLWPVNPV